MKDEIQQKLNQINQSEHIHFLLAVESGSRAWGFPSPDSDYDVRAIFIRPQQDYLSIEEPKSTFEYIESQWFDVGGWDLRKALQLLRKSNAVLLEWFNSPIVYQQQEAFIKDISPLLNEYFQVAPIVHHYRGIAKNALSQLDLNHEVKLKKWLYVLRPLLAADWAAKKKTIPPMNIFQLYLDLPNTLKAEIGELINLKATQPESYLHQLSPTLIRFTHDIYNEIDNLQIIPENRPLAVEPLNELFIKTLNRIR
ncbi:DNA polymerase beta superfamily protein [Glaesserella sp.]|uniref:nucleotidyltransferase domain-containing protein n=1 Tax=Glaesserella sp. TaxID=2094731 RepID=UPI0035A1899E